jgi:hypothetical protein
MARVVRDEDDQSDQRAAAHRSSYDEHRAESMNAFLAWLYPGLESEGRSLAPATLAGL